MRVRRWLRAGGGLAAILAVSGSLAGCGLVRSWGGGDALTTNLGGPCKWEDTFAGGTEDVVVSEPELGRFYVSADPRRPDELDGRGEIWLVTLDASGAMTKRAATDHRPEPFHPHGIDIWESADKTVRRLFVINHDFTRRDNDRVEIYAIQPDGSLKWLEGQHYKDLKRPNDLAAVGPRPSTPRTIAARSGR